MQVKAGIFHDDSVTWPPNYDIQEQLNAQEVLECFTDRLAAAIEQLTGPGRWRGDRRWGFWPVNFSYGQHLPYSYPTHGWHIDGNWFRHTVNSPKQGLLVIGLFTDIVPRGGGTILAPGSHKRTARVLARHHPTGLSHLDLFKEVLTEPLGDFYEVVGPAGDVILAHPFLFHTRGMKHTGLPRIISNTEAGLLHPMRIFEASLDDATVLEKSIILALEEAGGEVNVKNPVICRF
jgi:hypothetical protein